MGSFWMRAGPLATAVMLLIGAALKFPSALSEAFVAAGLVVLGAWLALEIMGVVDTHYKTHDPEPVKEEEP